MKRAIAFSSALAIPVALALLAAGCPSQSSPCQSNADCFQNQVCRDGLCVGATDGGANSDARTATDGDVVATDSDFRATDTSADDTSQTDSSVRDTATDSSGNGKHDTSASTDAEVDSSDCPDGGSKKKYYRDSDEDGYGDPNVVKTACSNPKGFVSGKGDCDDSVARVHKGQSSYFKMGYGPKGEKFDYDCDSLKEPKLKHTNPSCMMTSMGCLESEGWKANSPPGCGQTAKIGTCNSNCRLVYISRTEACK